MKFNLFADSADNGDITVVDYDEVYGKRLVSFQISDLEHCIALQMSLFNVRHSDSCLCRSSWNVWHDVYRCPGVWLELDQSIRQHFGENTRFTGVYTIYSTSVLWVVAFHNFCSGELFWRVRIALSVNITFFLSRTIFSPCGVHST